TPPDYRDAKPFHDALIAANVDNLVWGTDWPHPRPEGPLPDAANLLQVFLDWTPDARTRQAILVDNPAGLYDFPCA
ncbi:MAG TPA: amidohydrolase family protein, partial [Pseudolabrys sp.]|nr:amidohydrolase family protein [Pseudolabrys sp.]